MEESCLFPISGMITLRENQDVCWQRRENGGPSLGRRSPGRTSPGRTSPGRTSPGRDNPRRDNPRRDNLRRAIQERQSPVRLPTAAYLLYDQLQNLHVPQIPQNFATISELARQVFAHPLLPFYRSGLDHPKTSFNSIIILISLFPLFDRSNPPQFFCKTHVCASLSPTTYRECILFYISILARHFQLELSFRSSYFPPFKCYYSSLTKRQSNALELETKKKTKFYETTNGGTNRRIKNGKMIFQKLYNALSTPPTQTRSHRKTEAYILAKQWSDWIHFNGSLFVFLAKLFLIYHIIVLFFPCIFFKAKQLKLRFVFLI